MNQAGFWSNTNLLLLLLIAGFAPPLPLAPMLPSSAPPPLPLAALWLIAALKGGALAGVSPKRHFAGRAPRAYHPFPQDFVIRRWEEIADVHHKFFPGHASQTLHICLASCCRVQKLVGKRVEPFLLFRRSRPWPCTTLSGNLIPRQEHLIVQLFLTREGLSEVLCKSFPGHIGSTTFRYIEVAFFSGVQK